MKIKIPGSGPIQIFSRGGMFTMIPGDGPVQVSHPAGPSIGVVTTASPQTVVIQEWNATSLTTIDWGDGSTTAHPALTGTTVSHEYAAAGTYAVKLKVNPLAVTRMDFRGVGLRIYSSQLRACINTVYFRCSSGPLGVINSADMASWRPLTWYCFDLPVGFTGVINSPDMSPWRPTTWYCQNLPVGFTGVIEYAHFVAWNPTTWYCIGLPAGMRPLIVTAADFSGWVATSQFFISGNALTQAQVNAVLSGLYAAFATRSVNGGTINVGGNNLAPSGTLQAHCPPTTGKECAYELVNDSCAINPTKKWATVTITA